MCTINQGPQFRDEGFQSAFLRVLALDATLQGCLNWNVNVAALPCFILKCFCQAACPDLKEQREVVSAQPQLTASQSSRGTLLGRQCGKACQCHSQTLMIPLFTLFIACLASELSGDNTDNLYQIYCTSRTIRRAIKHKQF